MRSNFHKENNSNSLIPSFAGRKLVSAETVTSLESVAAS